MAFWESLFRTAFPYDLSEKLHTDRPFEPFDKLLRMTLQYPHQSKNTNHAGGQQNREAK
jgi:hypothetical protein